MAELSRNVILKEDNISNGIQFDSSTNTLKLKLSDESPIKIDGNGAITNDLSLSIDTDGKIITINSGTDSISESCDGFVNQGELESAKEELIGTSSDNADSNTIWGAKLYANNAINNLDYEDTTEPKTGFIKTVTQTNGAVSTTRSDIYASDLPSDIPTNKISSVLGNPNLTADINDLDTEISGHTADTNNPHAVTKAQVGLGNVDNTSDADKPISTATQNALNNKVDVVSGKQLSTEDFTTTLKTKLDNISAGAEVNVIETIQLDGTDLTVNNKTVNVNVKESLKIAINTALGEASDNNQIDLSTSDKIKEVLEAVLTALGFTVSE